MRADRENVGEESNRQPRFSTSHASPESLMTATARQPKHRSLLFYVLVRISLLGRVSLITAVGGFFYVVVMCSDGKVPEPPNKGRFMPTPN